VERLAAASEGLPLYVIEALTAGEGFVPETLPAGVSAVLRARLTAVGETAGQVLAAASVIGRSFDLATVRHTSGRTDEETVDALDEGLRRGLVREAPTGYDFVHGALRDLAYEATSLARRRLLHRRVAEALRLDLGGSGRDDLARLVLIATHERRRTRRGGQRGVPHGGRVRPGFANEDAIARRGARHGRPDAAGLHAAIGRLRTRTATTPRDHGPRGGRITRAGGAAELEWALGPPARGDLTPRPPSGRGGRRRAMTRRSRPACGSIGASSVGVSAIQAGGRRRRPGAGRRPSRRRSGLRWCGASDGSGRRRCGYATASTGTRGPRRLGRRS
jgi:hypothetical protein